MKTDNEESLPIHAAAPEEPEAERISLRSVRRCTLGFLALGFLVTLVGVLHAFFTLSIEPTSIVIKEHGSGLRVTASADVSTGNGIIAGTVRPSECTLQSNGVTLATTSLGHAVPQYKGSVRAEIDLDVNFEALHATIPAFVRDTMLVLICVVNAEAQVWGGTATIPFTYHLAPITLSASTLESLVRAKPTSRPTELLPHGSWRAATQDSKLVVHSPQYPFGVLANLTFGTKLAALGSESDLALEIMPLLEAAPDLGKLAPKLGSVAVERVLLERSLRVRTSHASASQGSQSRCAGTRPHDGS